jgi:hypothetical protein
MSVKLFLVALDDNGRSGPKIGCNDSLVSVSREIPRTTDPLSAALTALLSLKGETYGQSGLYNALGRSTLRLENVWVSDGAARVALSGTLTMAGACDGPRVEAELRQVVLQFEGIKTATFVLNGRPLAEAMSAR